VSAGQVHYFIAGGLAGGAGATGGSDVATSLLGMAEPTPMLPELRLLAAAMAVLTPMTWPAVLNSAPPESPGWVAASVWMASA
jgi:hypothetical protein